MRETTVEPDAVEIAPAVRLRCAAQQILLALPDEAMTEAWESLGRLWEFWQAQRKGGGT